MLEVGKVKALGLVLPLVVAAAMLAGCGSDGDEEAAAAGISSGTADRLAEMSDEVAASLASGDVCGAAARADDLRAAVSEVKIPADLRPEVEAGADQLVNEVNCEETTTTEQEGDEEKADEEEQRAEEEEQKAEEEEAGGGEGKDSESSGPPGQSGDFVPPGQAKIKGGI